MDYAVVKTIHQTAVALSIVGFVARGVGMFAGAAWARGRIAKTLPHGVDTLLLLSAITLVAMLGLNPLSTPWLMAKIGGLLLYIALGMLALRPALALPLRAAAWVGALVTFAWIASVAMSKNPAGFFG
jgi:uncharacterized membrane protein SirB2